MVSRIMLRKEAYRYILQILCQTSGEIGSIDLGQCIPLEELRQIREGISDPSPALVALLKDLFDGVISDMDIDSHLVVPFKMCQDQLD